MAQVINTNIASLTAQRNLNTSQSSLQISLQRLSSGLRINSAKDDAAGLAISDRVSGARSTHSSVPRDSTGHDTRQPGPPFRAPVATSNRQRWLRQTSVSPSSSPSPRSAP